LRPLKKYVVKKVPVVISLNIIKYFFFFFNFFKYLINSKDPDTNPQHWNKQRAVKQVPNEFDLFFAISRAESLSGKPKKTKFRSFSRLKTEPGSTVDVYNGGQKA
jgi:hypothetical protein